MNYSNDKLHVLEATLKDCKATLHNDKWVSMVGRGSQEYNEVWAMAMEIDEEIDERKRKKALAARIEMQEVRAMKIQMGVASYGY